MPEKLKFVAFHSFVDSSFFQTLSELKLNKFKLDESPQPICGYFPLNVYTKNQGPILNLSGDSFSESAVETLADSMPQNTAVFAQGSVVNMNTKEKFQSCDKNQYLTNLGHQLFDLIKSGAILKSPSKLVAFSVLAFSDLKKFKFYYWFSFPSLYTEWSVLSYEKANEEIIDTVRSWIENDAVDAENKPFFLLDAYNNPLPLTELVIDDKRNSSIRVGFIDSCTYEKAPAWYLRNFLTALVTYGYCDVEVFSYRSAGSYWMKLHTDKSKFSTESYPRVTGWEKTSSGLLQPKVADLQSLLSPLSLAEQAVDLNLKLMKWRVIPQIDLDSVKNTKCLLLGAGTLGSYVSRALLGWGVRKITFVDNGKVSFSNPVRQSLYTYEDCLDGGAPKAAAAARAVKKIFPQVESEGYDLEIPMIGHPVKDMEAEKANFSTLSRLIDEHDVVYLLMDSRETRWLPTVMCALKKKIVINAALGFDSYLVMRHGCPDEAHKETQLGCYFCNDVFAPSDSLTDRTLDQMCTVTRPGVALIASGLAVELMVSILQHPEGKFAGAKDTNILGEIPHQIRGFLHDFNNVKVNAPNYQYCSACSTAVINEFEKNGWNFVVEALNNSKYVEDISGLTKVQQEAEKAALDLDMAKMTVDDVDSIDEEWM